MNKEMTSQAALKKIKEFFPFIALTAICLLTGCTEKNTMIKLSSSVTSVDTTYLAGVESPQQKNVLIEEFTGVSCPPCPAGHKAVQNLKLQYPNRIVVIANHVFNFPQAAPVKDLSKQDFRTEDATEIGRLFGGVSFMPAAVIDRVKMKEEYLLSATTWALAVEEGMAKQSPINLSISTEYDETGKKANIKVRLAYTKAFPEKHALTLAITESEIIDAQKNQQSIDTFYTHNYVLRDLITPIDGDPVIDSIQTKEAGRVIERVFNVSINDNWRVENCKAVAIVHANDGTNKQAYQAAESSIKK